MNTGTIYDLTSKEYMDLGKIAEYSFPEIADRAIVQFLARIRNGHHLEIYLDSKGHPKGFYEDAEFEKWKEVELRNSEQEPDRSVANPLNQGTTPDPQKESEIERLRQEIQQQQTNEYYLRCSWDRTIQERDDYKNEAKALAAIKKGLETSLTECFARIKELEQQLEQSSKMNAAFLLSKITPDNQIPTEVKGQNTSK